MRGDVWGVQGNYGYGHGWEDLTAESERSDGLARLKEYQANVYNFTTCVCGWEGVRLTREGALFAGLTHCLGAQEVEP